MKEKENNIVWEAKPFKELSTQEFHDIIQLRVDVFVVEQNCPYRELDGKDSSSIHVLGRNSENKLIATARIAPAGLIYKDLSIGRVVTHQDYRGRKLGKLLMEYCLDFCREQYGSVPVKIAAQEYLERFYSNLGFKKISETYPWDGIDHIDMLLEY